MRLEEQIDILIEVDLTVKLEPVLAIKLGKFLNFLQNQLKELNTIKDNLHSTNTLEVIPNEDYKNNPVLKQYIKVIDVSLGTVHLSGEAQKIKELNDLMKKIYE